jgi:methionyl-tRNA formyltransferase
LNIAFIATGDIAIPTFHDLIKSGPVPSALITQPDKPVGRSQSSSVPPAIKTLALEHQIPVWQPEKIGEIADSLKQLNPDFIIVMAYGQIIGKAVRQAATKAIINLHASLLPKYRGASCIQSAIANGDEETGITIMHVIRELDAGNIISAKTIPIQSEDTAGEIHDRLAELGPATLREALQILSENPSYGTPQDIEKVSYSPKLLREDGRLDFSKSATELERIIRAYHPWPGTFTELEIKGKMKRLKIFPPTKIVDHALPANTLSLHEGDLLLGCGSQSLALSELQAEGSKQMPASAFANSFA